MDEILRGRKRVKVVVQRGLLPLLVLVVVELVLGQHRQVDVVLERGVTLSPSSELLGLKLETFIVKNYLFNLNLNKVSVSD